MIQDETVKKLLQICEPKHFSEKQYVCYEGQPGSEMYIVLRGSIGIYVTSAIDTQAEISRILPGDFFGEMSLFDNLPRSASCVALEDTICVSINKEKLADFFTVCPEMAAKLLENMSGRIRKLNNALYKTEHFVQNLRAPKFAVPEEYSFSHVVEEPYHNLDYAEVLNADCPICGKVVSVVNLKKKIMSVKKIDPDGRIRYAESDPLWNEIWSCPYCYYSNHYLSFFRMIPFKRDYIKRILKEQHVPVILKADYLKTPFDHLFLRYIRAIHINICVNADDSLLIGKLWLDLHWLFEDAADPGMSSYCMAQAVKYLKNAYDDNKIPDDYSRQSMALTIATLMSRLGSKQEALEMCEKVIDGEDKNLKKEGYSLKESIISA